MLRNFSGDVVGDVAENVVAANVVPMSRWLFLCRCFAAPAVGLTILNDSYTQKEMLNDFGCELTRRERKEEER